MTIVLTIQYGPFVLVCSGLFASVVSMIINCYPNKRLLSYGFIEQMKDIFPSTAIACVMGSIVGLINFIAFPDIVKLIIQVIVGVFIYCVLSKMLKLWSLDYLYNLIRRENKK